MVGEPVRGFVQVRASRATGAVAPVPPVTPVDPHAPRADEFQREFKGAARVSISPEGEALAAAARDAEGKHESEGAPELPGAAQGEADAQEAAAAARPEGAKASGVNAELSAEEQQQVEKMKSREREVHAHEQAHKSAGGAHAGAIHYDYQTGPDGQRYAVGGSVPIDASPVRGDPEATLTKMNQVARAATAPANPSGADMSVAARASANAAQARAELAQQRYAENQGGDKPPPGIASSNRG